MRYIIILLLFSICFGCSKNRRELPVLSYFISENGHKEFYFISYVNFRNQEGKQFTTEDIKGKVCLANFFFTRCPSICPPMRTELINIAQDFEDEDDFMIISHTIDPENDTVETLKLYAEQTGIPFNRWQFLRASVEQTKKQAQLFMTNFRPNESGTDFYHSSYVALIDKNQRIRGFYNSLAEDDVIRLKKDISSLLQL